MAAVAAAAVEADVADAVAGDVASGGAAGRDPAAVGTRHGHHRAAGFRFSKVNEEFSGR